MRILHTADWHLGKLIYGVSMLGDQQAFLEETLYPVIEQERPDCLVLSGDIFDRSVAPPQAIRLFESCVLKLCKTYRLPLLAISGNHDGADRIAPAAQLLREQGVYISTKIGDAFSPVALEKGGTAYHFHLLPYFEPAELRAHFKNEEIRGFSEAYRAAVGQMAQGFDKKAVHILCAHCFVTGCTVSDSESPICVGGSGEVSASLFEPFGLTLLGHLHAPQKAGENVFYSGSPLKYSFDEEHQKKSLSIIDIDGKDYEIRRIPVKAKRDMKTLTGSFHELCGKGSRKKDEDYIFVRLTDGRPVYMPVDRLREYYPNIMGLKSEFLSRGPEKSEGKISRTSTDEEILDLFLSQICSSGATPGDHALFLQAMNQAREEYQ